MTKMWQANDWPAEELEVLCTISITEFELGNTVSRSKAVLSQDFCRYRNILVYELNSSFKYCSYRTLFPVTSHINWIE